MSEEAANVTESAPNVPSKRGRKKGTKNKPKVVYSPPEGVRRSGRTKAVMDRFATETYDEIQKKLREEKKN